MSKTKLRLKLNYKLRVDLAVSEFTKLLLYSPLSKNTSKNINPEDGTTDELFRKRGYRIITSSFFRLTTTRYSGSATQYPVTEIFFPRHQRHCQDYCWYFDCSGDSLLCCAPS